MLIVNLKSINLLASIISQKSMIKKLPQSRLTSATNPIAEENLSQQSKPIVQKWRAGKTGLINSQQAILPLKLGKERIRKETDVNMHTQTVQNPEKIGIRTYKNANESHVFEDQTLFLSQSAIIGKNPSFIFNNSNYIPLSKSGQFSYLKQESHQNLQSNKGYAGTKNSKSRMYSNSNPIIEGEVIARHNSTLTNTWKEERRQRDNGANCANTLKWDCQLKKRQFYRPPAQRTEKTYKQMNSIIGQERQ